MMFIVLKVKEWVVKMKIGVISDLHIDRHSHLMLKAYITTLCDVVKQRDIEMLIIAGDISNHYQRSYQFIKQLKANSEISVVFIPGNHDFWIDETDQSSAEILEFYQSKAECLIGNPHIINDSWAIVGHTGCYDYSYTDSRFSQYKIERGQHYGGTW
ncbi:phosphohydrolase [Staphylococcus saccharolyticus]|uniref:Phosphohydrolase n=1 Tax=Staphylococcus saccharolyticus TaxID=33028 RepID=A0A380H289_9STAP|nr:phosphohydrolase [Staphylococcus saccharolyticus]